MYINEIVPTASAVERAKATDSEERRPLGRLPSCRLRRPFEENPPNVHNDHDRNFDVERDEVHRDKMGREGRPALHCFKETG